MKNSFFFFIDILKIKEYNKTYEHLFICFIDFLGGIMEDICEINTIHQDIVNNVKNVMPQDDLIYDLAEFYKVFADSTRMKIIYALMENELCVCDIAAIVGTTQSAISHQLRILKQAKLVKYKKDGKVVYYSLDDEHIAEIVKKGREHIEEL